jgi:two-component system LytT family sensor kinase
MKKLLSIVLLILLFQSVSANELNLLVIRSVNVSNLSFNIAALLLSAIMLFIFIHKGVFNRKPTSWQECNKQGFFLILVGVTYVFIRCLSSFTIREVQIILQFIIRAFLLVNLIFLAEQFLLKNVLQGNTRIVLTFLITLVGLFVISIPFNPTNLIFSLRLSELFPLLFAGAFLRSFYLFLNDWYRNVLNKKDLELARMSEFQKQAELQSLRAKINPHFLYNALNSIASLATTDAHKTEQMALALSDFFKYAINREQKQLNTLSEELNAIRTYLEIEKVRFGDRLSFEIDCPEDLLNIQIPQLLIQPLVENAIKHGLSQITENGLIRISVSRAETQLKIRVYDNGPAFPNGPLSGFGIQNTQERIALLYSAKASINWQNGAEKYVEISIPV